MSGPSDTRSQRLAWPATPCVAAAVTPLSSDGLEIDFDGCAEVASFLAHHQVDGIFALGTTGEGLLLDAKERHRASRAFISGAGGLPVIVHAGAASTLETIQMCETAASDGAAGVAVLAPPGFRLDEDAVVDHFVAAAEACSPTPFYAYVYTARSGYEVSARALARVQERTSNFVGVKISDPALDAVRPFLCNQYKVLIGAESLLPAALDAGADGVVSGLASAFPALLVDATRTRAQPATTAVSKLREAFAPIPLQAGLKRILRLLGLHINDAVRPPLRPLTATESREIAELLAANSSDGTPFT